MKNTIKNFAIVALVTFTAFSFTTIEENKKEIKTDKSEVVWKGYKVTGSHEGTIAIQSGSLTFEDEKLTGGEIVINMTTINTTDLEGEYKGKLDGHLKSDDFFGVANYPTATLVFKDVTASGKNAYAVSGELTIKGKTNPVTFTISIYGSKATASLKVDRTEYDVRYGSASFFDGLKDKAIYDEFDLVADLEF
ncbi:YceI family protein [uncultured Algibacter sp.]|jgi:polyisoprenoid-binding protein YceI|uniref:YceI family protein n=1 Tax=uncultured Algibacter sp. TaxID=298659 RepID=UPI0025F35885|nr:YceI family protein [uncultured Algibacter sp.]MDC1197334.1 YceI family protein [Algibacter sp.]